jgi:hypothetical protein
MDIERLPSGIFSLRHALHVEPNVADRLPQAGPPNPEPWSPTAANAYYLRENVEFRTENPSIGMDDDRRYLPLLEVSIDVAVISTTSRTFLTQKFWNPSNVPIDKATYCFPLYNGSIVVAFRCWIGDNKLLKGIVKPKELAEAEFQEAVSRQRAAVLLEELTPEVFETQLGNIPHHTTVKVEIEYINELKADLSGEGVLVTIPTSVAPRYGTPPEAYTQAAASNVSKATPVENGLTIRVEVSDSVLIKTLECRTHPIKVEFNVRGRSMPVSSFGHLAQASASMSMSAPPILADASSITRATLSDLSTTLGKDFVLIILANNKSILTLRAALEPHPTLPHNSALRVTISPGELFAPKIAIEKATAEIIFLADRSGSMASKMESLRSAMRIFLKSIPQSCYFNICSFGSTYWSLWTESRPNIQVNVDAATRHVMYSFKSDMGGTEILSALQSAVERRNTQKNMTTEIIILTDGEVWDTDNVIKFVQETRAKTEQKVRFFALGIGNAVSHRLVEGIGCQGGGFAEVVAVDGKGEWESGVIRMLKGALTPSQWQCEIVLPNEIGASVSMSAKSESTKGNSRKKLTLPRPRILQAPNCIPSLHAFSRSSVYFFINPQVLRGISSITVRAVASSGEKFEIEIPLEESKAQPLIIHHLAAKALMNDLQRGQSWMHADKYQEYRINNADDFEKAVQKEAEEIGMKWSISGQWTSFVAVDNSDRTEQKTRIYPALRTELVDLTRSRGVSMLGARRHAFGNINQNNSSSHILDQSVPSFSRSRKCRRLPQYLPQVGYSAAQLEDQHSYSITSQGRHDIGQSGYYPSYGGHSNSTVTSENSGTSHVGCDTGPPGHSAPPPLYPFAQSENDAILPLYSYAQSGYPPILPKHSAASSAESGDVKGSGGRRRGHSAYEDSSTAQKNSE